MLYTTFKENKAHGITDSEIYIQYEECYGNAGELFGDEYTIEDNWGDRETNDEKLFNDFTDRQVASACLKALKQLAKDKEDPLLVWNKMFFDLDIADYCYDEVVKLIESGEITGRKQLADLNSKAKKKGYTIKKEVEYDTENHYFRVSYLDDLADEYFPCYAEQNDDFCNDCGNCQ